MMPANAPVEPLKLFRTFARNLPMSSAMEALGSYLLGREFSVGRREREIVIDRVSARCRCEYEWGVHAVAWGARAGLTAAQLAATVASGRVEEFWSPEDRLLIRLVDELHDTAKISKNLWRELEQRWSPEQLLDLMLLAGWYHAICFIANGAQVEREEWGARFPAISHALDKR
jgi:alkylhydroperoxidase family enzyme